MKPKIERLNSPVLLESLARGLGQDTFESVKEHASEIVAWEKIRREKSNLSEIVTLKARFDSLFRLRSELLEFLRLAPQDDPAHLFAKRWYYRAFAGILILAGIFFAHLALAPYGLGWEAWIVCLGIAGVAAFWTEQTLEKIDCERLVQPICVIALLASLAGILAMALLRGDILALYVKSAIGTADVSGDAGTAFYAHTLWKLQSLMALLAIAMELGSGMAIFESGKLDLGKYERAKEAKTELAKTEDEMGTIIGRVTHLENDPVMNEAEFWRNFRLGFLERMKRNGLALFLSFVIFGSLAVAPSARAKNPVDTRFETAAPNVVIAIDFTQSVSGKGYDGKTDYQKNVDAACRLISQLPPGTHFTVFAITDRSFAQPYVLLDRDIPLDKGPLQFLDQVTLSKTRAASELRKLASLSPHAIPRTDIFGALILSADILRASPRRKVLVVFSDMRESSATLDFEHEKTIAKRTTLATVEKEGLVPRLHGVDVYVLGVDGTGRSIPYWNSLRDFWEAYFGKAQANLKAFSALRDLSSFGGESQ
jgi:hypothetical protein